MSTLKTSLWVLTPFWILNLASIILILISAANHFENYEYNGFEVTYTTDEGFGRSHYRFVEALL